MIATGCQNKYRALWKRSLPLPAIGDVRIRVEAGAICRTDLHVVEGDLPSPRLPLVPGHESVGGVAALESVAFTPI